ncbi:MAG: PAS domain S-box protein, partial [Fidelibacterota bacterium]
MREGRIQGWETVWVRKDGSRLIIRESANLIKDPQGKVLYIEGAVEDITREKESRRALQEERQLFRSGPMVIFRWRAGEEQIPIDYVSPNVEALYGYSAEQMIRGDIHYDVLVHPDDLERVNKEVQEHAAAGETQFSQRYRILDAKGGLHWIHDLTTIIRNRQGQVTNYVGYITDITRMVSLSKELEQKDRLIRNVLKQAQEGILVTDDSGIIVEWSQGMAKITSLSAKEVIGRPAWEVQMEFISVENLTRTRKRDLKAAFQSLLKAGDIPQDIQMSSVMLNRPDGVRKNVQIVLSKFKTESSYGLIGFVRDETDIIQTTRHLEETQKRYATLFQASPDGFILEDNRGTIIDCNPASCEILGYDRDELVGMNVQEFTGLESRKEVRANIRTILKTGYLRHEVENFRRDGTCITLDLHEVKVPLPNGEEGILVIHRDVTEQKQVERELRQRDRILSVITAAAEAVLQSESWTQCADTVLADLGQVIGATRVTMYENQKSKSGVPLALVRGSWAARGFAIKKRKRARSFQDLGLDPWRSQFEKGEKIIARISDTDLENQAYFEINKSKSILAIPIFSGSEQWGILCFDDGQSEREWSEMEVESLTIAANLFGTSIQRDISDAALKRLAESVSATPEETFFESLVLELSEVLGCDFAFVGELINQDPEQVQTIALARDGKLVSNILYDLKNTPCENVIGKEYRQYLSGVQMKFPKDKLLQELGVDSYCGMPLFSSGKKKMGIMAVM